MNCFGPQIIPPRGLPTKYLGSPRGGIICGPKQFIERASFDQHDADKEACSWRHNDIADDVTAAILIEQLNRLEETKQLRKEKAEYYDKLIANAGLIVTKPTAHNEYNYRYCLFLQNKHAKYVVDRCKARGVMVEQPVFSYTETFSQGQRDFLTNTMLAFKTVISLPLYSTITEFEQVRVVNVLKEVLNG
jgi:dTDP-4-amino-4,6-dideoxygalactose transaminase